MYCLRYFIDRKYLSIAFSYEEHDDREQWGFFFTAWVFDISVRPIFICHTAVIWTAFLRCQNFVFLCTSFPRFSYNSDISETDEAFIYPNLDAPGFLNFVAFVWGDAFLAVANRFRIAFLILKDIFRMTTLSITRKIGSLRIGGWFTNLLKVIISNERKSDRSFSRCNNPKKENATLCHRSL